MSDAVPKLPVTVVIATLNESARVRDAIRSVSWAAEIIVADGGSTDDTMALARAEGALAISLAGMTIGAQRNAAIEQARHEWIFALDADERASPALRDQFAGVMASPAFGAYRVCRENTYLGRVMRHGQMARDWHTCFFRQTYRYNSALVHERLIGVTVTGRLSGPVFHTPYRDLAHHADKILRYARWAADDRAPRGRRASLADLVFRGPLRFTRDYVFYGGWRDGWRGAIAATMSGYSAFLRAAFLRESQDGR